MQHFLAITNFFHAIFIYEPYDSTTVYNETYDSNRQRVNNMYHSVEIVLHGWILTMNSLQVTRKRI